MMDLSHAVAVVLGAVIAWASWLISDALYMWRRTKP